MREILFRGKRIDNGEWVEGYYIGEQEMIGKKAHWILDINDYFKRFHYRSIDPDTVGQYTGLTDKNGKRIFDGDIIHYQCSDVIAEVKIGEYRDTDSRKDAYGCYVEFVEDDQIIQEVMNHMESNETYGCEVIGNIYDNPELLEDKQHKIHAHSFDFTRQDAEDIMSAFRIVWLLSREDYPHNWQYERSDIVSYIRGTNAIIKIAKRFVEKCPLKNVFRIKSEEDKQ